MAVSLVRGGGVCLRGAARRLLVPTAAAPMLHPQAAGIKSKVLQDKDYKRPTPFQYKKEEYGFWASMVDRTMHRFDENSKIVVVDGPIAAGKAKFAKELAADLDMMYMPACSMDIRYINSYGYDMRQLDPQLPDKCKSFDTKDFVSQPNHLNAPRFQFDMYKLKLGQYVDALTHVLNTGQGVVMDRSVYGDFVYMETMVQFGFMSKDARTVYYAARSQSLPELLRPHLVVYLDVPVNEVKRRIMARPPPYPTSPFHTTEVLAYMENVYKHQYLKEISNHAELLIYDWSETGDVEVVVEDIERLNLDDFGPYDPKMQDWRIERELEWTNLRIKYSKNRQHVIELMTVPALDVEELAVSGEDNKKFKEVWWNAPGMKFVEGFNADMGDTQIVIKTKAGI